MTDTVHPTAARGFDVGADAYERARPTYPPEAVATLAGALDLRPGRTVLELGAGTGKLTRLLVPTGARILALEPVEGMRSKLDEAVPSAVIVEGTAEAIPLPGGSVDAVVVAQAFHWFDAIRALSEIHRVLRPDGMLALAWNFRDESVPWVRALGEHIHELAGEEPRARGGVWRAALGRCGLFTPFTSVELKHTQQLTTAGVLDRVASISYVAAADPVARSRLLADVAALLDDDPATAGRDTMELPYTAEVMWAARRTIEPGTAGIVASVNLNEGGVPKPPVDGARVLRLGLDGDGHAEPEPIHGGVEQAVCLYPQEAVERVREDGHEAFPGAFGENLTLLGIDWATLATGDLLELGDRGEGVLLELTAYASPCQTIAHWFDGRRIARISHKVNPQDARWYARVLRDGPVAPGMAVRLERGSTRPAPAY